MSKLLALRDEMEQMGRNAYPSKLAHLAKELGAMDAIINTPALAEKALKTGTLSRSDFRNAGFAGSTSAQFRKQVAKEVKNRVALEGLPETPQQLNSPRYEGFWDEFAKSFAGGSYDVASGLVGGIGGGTISPLRGPQKVPRLSEDPLDYARAVRGLQEAVLTGKAGKIRKAGQSKYPPAEGGGWRAFVAQAVGRAMPYMGAAMAGAAVVGPAGAFMVGTSVEGNEAYFSAKELGASEDDARLNGFIVGTINGAIESLQVSQVVSFGKYGRGAVKGVVEAARKKAWSKLAKQMGKLTIKQVEHAVREGLEEALQETTSIAAEQRVSRKPLDKKAAGRRIGMAATGGAVAGVVLGAGESIAQTGKFQEEISEEKVKTETEELLRPEQGEPVTPESLMRDRLRLFESEKNVKLSEQQEDEAMAWLSGRIAKKEKGEGKGIHIVLPPDDEIEKKLMTITGLEVLAAGAQPAKTPLKTPLPPVEARAPAEPTPTTPKPVPAVKEGQKELFGADLRRNTVIPKEYAGKTGEQVQSEVDDLIDKYAASGMTLEEADAQPDVIALEEIAQAIDQKAYDTDYSTIRNKIRAELPDLSNKNIEEILATAGLEKDPHFLGGLHEGLDETVMRKLRNPQTATDIADALIGQWADSHGIERSMIETARAIGPYTETYWKNLKKEIENKTRRIIVALQDMFGVSKAETTARKSLPPAAKAAPAEARQKEAIAKMEGGKIPLKPEGKLKGGRAAGATTLIPDAAVELASITRSLISNPAELAKATTKWAVRNVREGKKHIKTLGGAGKLTANDLDDIVRRATTASNNDAMDIRDVFKGLSKARREQVAKIVNERTEGKQPTKLVEKANRLREILDRSMNAANEVGMTRKVRGKKMPIGGKGKAFPQVPNAEGVKFLKEAENKGVASKRVFVWATEQVKAGKFKTVDQAVSALQNYRESAMRGISRYLETTRVELPEELIEWDGKYILHNLLERNWNTVEAVRKWGPKFERISSRTEQIAAGYGRKEADRVEKFIKVSFGVASPASEEAQIISNRIRGYQFTMKVGLSPSTIIRNMADRLAKAWTISQNPILHMKASIQYPPFLNQFIKSAQEIEEDMIRRGAVFGHGSLAEGFEAGSALADVGARPFSASERGNQVKIALVRYMQLMNDIAAFNKRAGKDSVVTQIVNRIGLKTKDPLKYRIAEHGGEKIIKALEAGEPVSADMISEVLHATVRDKAFPMVISTKPLWYDAHPMARVAAQFKTWPMRQTAMIWNDVVKYTVKTGDPRRLIGFLLGTLVAGEIYNIVRDFLFDKDESILAQFGKENKQFGRAILNDLIDGGVVGMLADFTYGIFDWATGPAVSTGKNIKIAATEIYKRPVMTPYALRKLVEKETTPVRQIMGVWDKIDRAFINENNLTKDYTRIRGAAFEFKNDYLNPDWADKLKKNTDDILWGVRKYRPGDNTLAYQMAARQITVGDTQDAADFIRIILDGGIDTATIKSTLEQHYSPVGPVRKGKRAKFYKDLGPTDGPKARNVQLRWKRQMAAAIMAARKKD